MRRSPPPFYFIKSDRLYHYSFIKSNRLHHSSLIKRDRVDSTPQVLKAVEGLSRANQKPAPKTPGKIDFRVLSAGDSSEDSLAKDLLAVPKPPGKISTPSFAVLSHQ